MLKTEDRDLQMSGIPEEVEGQQQQQNQIQGPEEGMDHDHHEQQGQMGQHEQGVESGIESGIESGVDSQQTQPLGVVTNHETPVVAHNDEEHSGFHTPRGSSDFPFGY